MISHWDWMMNHGPHCIESNLMHKISTLPLVTLCAGLLFAPVALAQPDRSGPGPDREALRERMEALAVGFLTERLELDAESAQVFWPIFNAHADKKKTAAENERNAKRALADFSGNDQNAFSALLDELERAEVASAGFRSDFLREVAAAFDPEFAIRCIEANREFERMMRERMQERMSPEDRRALGKMGRGPGRQRRP